MAEVLAIISDDKQQTGNFIPERELDYPREMEYTTALHNFIFQQIGRGEHSGSGRVLVKLAEGMLVEGEFDYQVPDFPDLGS